MIEMLKEKNQKMLHARPDYNDRIQDIDIPALKILFEEMLEEIKGEFLVKWSDSRDGSVHPAGQSRWDTEEKGYRQRFGEIMTGKIPANEPVFLLRGQDAAAGAAVDVWIQFHGNVLKGDPVLTKTARQQSLRISEWPKKKTADGPKE